MGLYLDLHHHFRAKTPLPRLSFNPNCMFCLGSSYSRPSLKAKKDYLTLLYQELSILCKETKSETRALSCVLQDNNQDEHSDKSLLILLYKTNMV